MDPLLIIIAFLLGFGARRVGLPPLVGYLVAGFVLHALADPVMERFEIDITGGLLINELAELGVLLLLFSIGLKLKIGSLLRAEIWGGTSAHMLATVVVFGTGIFLLSALGLPKFTDLDWKLSLLVAFALSFSSTVFAVKVLEEAGEMSSLHGRTAIGILIMQDIFAIVFMTISKGQLPSPWALLLLGLIPGRLLLIWIMEKCGHGEMLIMYGLLLTIAIAGAFDAVGLKPDLGALIAGILVGRSPKADELSKTLMGFKDLFLVGFFLSVGLSGAPGWAEIGVALLAVVVLPFKIGLFFWLLTRYRLRGRTAALTTLSLSNYSEFGLIVGAVAVGDGWLDPSWLVIVALALSISFAAAAPLNAMSHTICARLRDRLARYERDEHHPEDRPIDPGDAEIVIFGIGRVGRGAYDVMHERYGDVVLGVDSDPERAAAEVAAGRRVVIGDATDAGFWAKIKPSATIRLVMLAMPEHRQNLFAAQQLAEIGFPGTIVAVARHDDERRLLEEAGVHRVFNYYAEVGAGFADHACELLEPRPET